MRNYLFINNSLHFLKIDDIGKYKFSKIFHVMYALIWFTLIYNSIDLYATKGELDIFQSLFDKKFNDITLAEITSILLPLYSIFYFKIRTRQSNISSVFFILTIILIIINFLNPNNNLTTLKYIFGPPLSFYILLLWGYSFFKIPNSIYVYVYNKLLSLGFIVLLLRSLQAIFLFMIGRGMSWFGKPSTIVNMDILIYLAAFQTIFIGKFLNSKKFIDLVFSLFFLTVLILSYRRSALLLAVISNLFILIYYTYITERKTVLLRILFTMLTIAFFSSLIIPTISPKLKNLFARYTGAFSYFMDSPQKNQDYTDSGHMEQSIVTTKTFISEFTEKFWGAGYGNKAFFVHGQFSEAGPKSAGYIHNSFVYAWAQWGLHATVYLLLLMTLLSWILLKIIKIKYNDFVIFSIIVFLFSFILIGWSNGIIFLGTSNYCVFFIIFFSSVKCLPLDV
jgi:hypothetical protein